MHDETRDTYESGMSGLALEIATLEPAGRDVIARLLKLDIDLFSVAARAADMLEEDYRQRNSPMPAIATCLYALLTHCIRMKVDALGPLAFEDPAPGSNG